MKIILQKPCTLSWENMQAHPEGKFCLSCAKQVIDFTHMNDTEILKTLQEKPNGICGRLYKHQLNRPLYRYTTPRQAPALKKILAGVVLFTGIYQSTTAQTTVTAAMQQENTNQHETINAMQTQKNFKGQLNGRVFDADTREPLAGCMIYIKDSNLSAVTNPDGRFTLDIPSSMTNDTVNLQLNYIGYDTLLTSYPTNQLPHSTQHYLMQKQDDILMGDVYIIEEPEDTKGKLKKNRKN